VERLRPKGNMTLPISLIVAAVLVFLFGVLHLPSKAKSHSTSGALLLWFCLFFGGIAIWMWAAHIR
jgi:protein-S-isoprenylcysteine O-methyltransferase Ste14